MSYKIAFFSILWISGSSSPINSEEYGMHCILCSSPVIHFIPVSFHYTLYVMLPTIGLYAILLAIYICMPWSSSVIHCLSCLCKLFTVCHAPRNLYFVMQLSSRIIHCISCKWYTVSHGPHELYITPCSLQIIHCMPWSSGIKLYMSCSSRIVHCKRHGPFYYYTVYHGPCKLYSICHDSRKL